MPWSWLPLTICDLRTQVAFQTSHSHNPVGRTWPTLSFSGTLWSSCPLAGFLLVDTGGWWSHCLNCYTPLAPVSQMMLHPFLVPTLVKTMFIFPSLPKPLFSKDHPLTLKPAWYHACSFVNLSRRLLTYLSISVTSAMSVLDLWILVTKEKAGLSVFMAVVLDIFILPVSLFLSFCSFYFLLLVSLPYDGTDSHKLVRSTDFWWLSWSHCVDSLKFKVVGQWYHRNWQRLTIGSDNPPKRL